MKQFRAFDQRALLVLVDFAVALTGFMGAGLLRFGPGFVSIWNADPRYPDVGVLAPAVAVTVVGVFWMVGLYRGERYLSITRELADLARGVAMTALFLLSVLYMAKLQELSRVTLALFFLLLLVGGGLVRLSVGLRAQSGVFADQAAQVLLVGTFGADRILAAFDRGGPPVNLVGFVGRDSPGVASLSRLGDLTDLPDLLGKTVVDEVVVCLPVEEWGRLDAIAGVCAEQGKVMRVPVDVARNTLRSGRIEYLDSIPLLTLVTTAGARAGMVAKRALDIVVSGLLLLGLAPLFVAIATALLVTDGRPVFFSQVRGGLNGRPFRFHKFRTMVPDAEELKEGLAELNERNGPMFKMASDPRVTRVGRLLRRSSLDELPQLWNVLVGDMSLVGPRPPTMDEVELYDRWHRRRLSVRPGITGIGQVIARHDPDFDRWVDLDLQYIDTWSFWNDVRILLRTPLAMVRTPGS
jgi:exopolysaccharide biosynthesis polyprenyl glycosylphosphotransferase